MENNSEAPGEKPVSDLTENFNSAKTIKSNELDGLLKTEKLFTIVQVTDMDNLPFVLIGDEDPEGYRRWVVFSGESKDELTRVTGWYKEAKRLYEDKARSPEEMDYLRRVMISFSTIEPLIQEPQYTHDLFGMCIAGIAKMWYDADHKDDKPMDINSFEEAQDICMPYLRLVNVYVERLAALMTAAHAATQVRE